MNNNKLGIVTNSTVYAINIQNSNEGLVKMFDRYYSHLLIVLNILFLRE